MQKMQYRGSKAQVFFSSLADHKQRAKYLVVVFGVYWIESIEARMICKDNENVHIVGPLRRGRDTVWNELREEGKQRRNNRSHGVNEKERGRRRWRKRKKKTG